MAAITQVISALTYLPAIGQAQATFDSNVNGHINTDLPTLISQVNTWGTQANALAAAINAAIAGGAFAIDYTFSTTTTAADPGAGLMRLNASTQNTATAMYLDVLDSAGSDYTAAIDLFDDSTSTIKGFLMLRKADDGTKFLLFALTSMSAPSGYRTPVVTCVASSSASPFANGDAVTLAFSRTGDKGDKGDKGDAGDVSLTGTATGAINMADYGLSRAMEKDCGLVIVDKGNSGTSTQTLDYTAGSHQKITATGNHTIATSNWPPSGNTGLLLLELVNGGAYTLTWPTVNWIKPDGTTTTSISTFLAANTGRTALQSSGTDFLLLWSRDAGTTIYGKLV